MATPRTRMRAGSVVVMASILAFAWASPAPAAESPSGAILKRLETDAGTQAKATARPPAARGGVDLEPCDEAPGGACGRVLVPLDRSNPQSEEISLFFEYYEHTGPGPTDEAI